MALLMDIALMIAFAFLNLIVAILITLLIIAVFASLMIARIELHRPAPPRRQPPAQQRGFRRRLNFDF